MAIPQSIFLPMDVTSNQKKRKFTKLDREATFAKPGRQKLKPNFKVDSTYTSMGETLAKKGSAGGHPSASKAETLAKKRGSAGGHPSASKAETLGKNYGSAGGKHASDSIAETLAEKRKRARDQRAYNKRKRRRQAALAVDRTVVGDIFRLDDEIIFDVKDPRNDCTGTIVEFGPHYMEVKHTKIPTLQLVGGVTSDDMAIPEHTPEEIKSVVSYAKVRGWTRDHYDKLEKSTDKDDIGRYFIVVAWFCSAVSHEWIVA